MLICASVAIPGVSIADVAIEDIPIVGVATVGDATADIYTLSTCHLLLLQLSAGYIL